MARIRSVKPEFWTDEKIVDLSAFARLLFIGLWNFADDYGRMIYSPKRIKMQIFPGDNLDMEALLGEIRGDSLVSIYVVDGIEYLQVNGFAKHQKIDKRSASKYPPPTEPPRVLEKNSLGREGIKEVEVEGKDSKTGSAAKHSRATPPVDNSVDKHIAAAAPTADATQNRTAELTAMLRKRGAALPDDDPNVRKWAQAGISDAHALAALETAQQRRAEAYSSQPINSGYLDSIITGTDSKPGKPKKANATPWWTSNELMTAKARELKITPPMPGESWEQFRGRINAKLAEAVEKAET